MADRTGEVTAFHGSGEEIRGMPSLDRARTPGERAVFLTDNADEAAEWAGAHLYEARLDTTGFLRVRYPEVRDPDGVLAETDRAHLYDAECMAAIVARAVAEGEPGVVIEDVQNFEDGRVTTTYAVLDTAAILSFERTWPEGTEPDEDGPSGPAPF